jgi:hypothetical protein
VVVPLNNEAEVVGELHRRLKHTMIIGEYLGRVFNETKRRRQYLPEGYPPDEAAAAIGPFGARPDANFARSLTA